MNAPETRYLSAAERYARTARQLLIDGRGSPALSGKTFEVHNPVNGEIIAHVAEGDAADVDLAVAVARSAFPIWTTLPPAARAQILWKVGELIDKHAQELSAHLGVDKVAFTGSTEVGKLIVQAAAGHLKKVSLELDGKSPNIVLADADVDAAIAGSANAIFFNSGQVRVAGSRLYADRKIFDRVVDGVCQGVNRAVPADEDGIRTTVA